MFDKFKNHWFGRWMENLGLFIVTFITSLLGGWISYKLATTDQTKKVEILNQNCIK